MIHSLANKGLDFALRNPDERGYGFLSTETTAASLSRSSRTDIVLITQEGDKVTLSAATQYEEKYATYEVLAGAGGMMARVQGMSFEMNAGTSFSMTVEGDLSASEMADVGKALKTIDKIMADLISGNYDKLVHHARKLGGLDSLQSLSADLAYEEEIQYSQTETRLLSAIEDASGTEAPASQADPQVAQTAEAAAVDGMADAAGGLSANLLTFLDHYFTKLSEKMADRPSNAPDKTDMIERIKSRLMKRLEPEGDG